MGQTVQQSRAVVKHSPRLSLSLSHRNSIQIATTQAADEMGTNEARASSKFKRNDTRDVYNYDDIYKSKGTHESYTKIVVWSIFHRFKPIPLLALLKTDAVSQRSLCTHEYQRRHLIMPFGLHWSPLLHMHPIHVLCCKHPRAT